MRRFFEVPAHVGIYILAILLAAVQAYDMLTRPLPLPQVVEVANRSVVSIVCGNGKEAVLTGGFVSSDKGYVTTVAHGLSNCTGENQKNIYVSFNHKPGLYSAKIVRYNRMIDVAILYIKSMPDIDSLVIATDVQVGEHVTALGHPHALFWSVADGIISADRWTEQPARHLVQVSCPLIPGNSGGPIINDKGQVVGIASFSVDAIPTLGFIIPGDFIKMVAQGLYP